MFKLNEALEAIKNKPEFTVREREYGTVIDYNVTFAETFIGQTERETLILQNLRGTVFNKDGVIIRLAYHKFHNLGENAEYAVDKFNFDDPHVILDKLDGSMIAPIPLSYDTWVLGTRAGVTEVSEKATALLESWKTSAPARYEYYKTFITTCTSSNYTPLFEFCSRAQRIVIDYPVADLVLTNVRCNKTGSYSSFLMWVARKSEHISTVRAHDTEHVSISALAHLVKQYEQDEGVVVCFSDGRFVKIKADAYCLKHRALDGLRFEKDVLSLVVSNTLDDVLPLVDDATKARLVQYRDQVMGRLRLATDEMQSIFDRHCNVNSKKEFAELIKHSVYRAGLFKLWDTGVYSLYDMVLRHCNTQTAVDEVRWLIGEPYEKN